MEEKRGNQKPTQSFILPYEKTRGGEAIALYEKTGRAAQEWQAKLVNNIMAVGEDGLWRHMKFGYSVPRRNGKTEAVYMIELWALMQGLRVLHTAHRTTTSHASWEKLCYLLEKTGCKEKEGYKSTKQFGLEKIELLDQSEGCINYRTRSSKGGLGEGFDLLIIDEAQEYTEDQDTALKYVVSDSQNPLTIYLGTPPTAVSAGTVFPKFREKTLQGKNEDAGWEEWSVEHMTVQDDVEAWYLTNPSLGMILNERKIRSEIGSDEIDFNIQRLGLWIKYNQKSAISLTEWRGLQIKEVPALKKGLYIGIKFGHDGLNVAMSVAVKTEDERILIDGVDCRPIRAGTEWIAAWIKNADPNAIVIDGDSGKNILAAELKDAKVKKRPTLLKVGEIITAGTLFEQGIEGRTICHFGQPSMVQSVTNCEKRAIGSGGGFGYKSAREGIEVALLESALLAHYACATAKEKTRQKSSY